MATVTVHQTKNARRVIICPFGHEYSADASDYWMGGDTTPFTCDCQGEPIECDLVERISVSGTDDKGRTYGASGWVTIKQAATLGDLRNL